jgi:hypothetical protein
MKLSNLKQSDFGGRGHTIELTYKGWTCLIEYTGSCFTSKLSVSTHASSDAGVYCSEIGWCSTIKELKEEIKHEVGSFMAYTAKEAAEWNVKLGNGVCTFDKLVIKINAYKKEELFFDVCSYQCEYLLRTINQLEEQKNEFNATTPLFDLLDFEQEFSRSDYDKRMFSLRISKTKLDAMCHDPEYERMSA